MKQKLLKINQVKEILEVSRAKVYEFIN